MCCMLFVYFSFVETMKIGGERIAKGYTKYIYLFIYISSPNGT